jgi:hypothetical protein
MIFSPDALDRQERVRVAAVQGTQVWAGPLHVGVMSARDGELPGGGTGLRAGLSISLEGRTDVFVVLAGESVEFPGQGTLTVVAISPPGSVDGVGRLGVVALEFVGAAEAKHEVEQEADRELPGSENGSGR